MSSGGREQTATPSHGRVTRPVVSAGRRSASLPGMFMTLYKHISVNTADRWQKTRLPLLLMELSLEEGALVGLW